MTIRKPFVVVGVVIALGALEVVMYSLLSPTPHVVSPVATTTAQVPSQVEVSNTASSSPNLGTYAYQCDEHVSFALTPSNDMKTIAVKPIGGAFPPASTLVRKTAQTGVRYEGSGVVLTAHGETVTLGEGDSAITCSPAELPDMAPFNFGD